MTSSKAQFPQGTQETFQAAVREAVELFPSNATCRKIDAGTFAAPDYHRLLRTLFHQTFEAPSTFALAGAHCEFRHFAVRDYLLRHAEEERTHWTWVINDLRATGDAAPDPRESFPCPATQAYVAFNLYIATRAPVARLGAAATLESIGATYGKSYATKLMHGLNLQPSQLSFFFGHGDTDVGHSAEILHLLSDADLNPHEWGWVEHAARTAGVLYRQMYDEAGR